METTKAWDGRYVRAFTCVECREVVEFDNMTSHICDACSESLCDKCYPLCDREEMGWVLCTECEEREGERGEG